jgi:uncharacterized Tic20 family protein
MESFAGKPCPKCSHVRSGAEAAPEWQCPKCGIAYAKYVPPAAAVKSPMRAEPSAAPVPAAPVEAAGGDSSGIANLAHLSTLANYLLPPAGTLVAIGIWVAKNGQDEFAVDCAKEALNFQLSTFLWSLAVLLPALVFPPFIVVSVVVLIAVVIAGIVLPIIGAMRSSEGLMYYYPYTWHIFGDGPSG